MAPMPPDDLTRWLLRETLLRTLAGIEPGDPWEPSTPPPPRDPPAT